MPHDEIRWKIIGLHKYRFYVVANIAANALDGKAVAVDDEIEKDSGKGRQHENYVIEFVNVGNHETHGCGDESKLEADHLRPDTLRL